jgi:hypothetical protein
MTLLDRNVQELDEIKKKKRKYPKQLKSDKWVY